MSKRTSIVLAVVALIAAGTAWALNPVEAGEGRSNVPLIVAEKGEDAFGLSNAWAKLKTDRATEKVAMGRDGSVGNSSWETKWFEIGPENDKVAIPFIAGAKLKSIPDRYSETYAIDPTGSKVAITDQRLTDLWMIDLPTSKVTKLTGDGVGGINRSALQEKLRQTNVEEGGSLIWATKPIWSPTGEWIAFSSNRTGTPGQSMYHAVMVVRADATDERILATPDSLNARGPLAVLGWQQNGNVLVADVAAKTVHSVGLDGNAHVLLSDVRPPFALSADGRYLTHYVHGKMAIADLKTGEPLVQSLPSGMSEATKGAWSPEGSYYAVLAYPPAFSAKELETRPVKLLVMDMATRQVRELSPSSGRLDITIPLQWLNADTVLAGTDKGAPLRIRLGGGK